MSDFTKFAVGLVAFLLIMWLFFVFVVGFRMAPNNDMSPSINAGDILLYYKGGAVTDKDVIAVKKENKLYFLRVVAKGGDTVDITEDGLLINGNTVMEDKADGETYQYAGHTEFPLTLKKGEYFVLADHRAGGEDSRYFGTVRDSEIKGVVIAVIRKSGI